MLPRSSTSRSCPYRRDATTRQNCICSFQTAISPNSLRSPGELTQLAAVLLLAFKKSLYPRARFGEAITVMQQWLLSLVLGHTLFVLVDLLNCEWEDWIADRFKGKRRIPYAHVMCHLLAKTVGFPNKRWY
jgi:hypothetical protein